MEKYTCIIVEDEIKVASHLNHLISDFTDLEVLQVETNPTQAVEYICKLKPDIVFLDVEMPEKSGFELIDDVRKRSVFPAFVLVTAFDHYAIKAVKGSSFDYLLKPVDIDELKDCIARYKRTREITIAGKDIDLPINPREKEVLALVVKGMTSKEIGEQLFISKATVETHRQNIRAKTGVKTTAELIALTLKKMH